MKIGDLVKEARQRAGMTLTELGEKIGSSSSALCDLERGNLKNPPSVFDLVKISDALMDRKLLSEFCNDCPLRDRIRIQKFKPLNNIVPGAIPAMIKTIQKISVAAEALESMMRLLCNSTFRDDPEYLSYLNSFFLRVIEAQNGLEIVVQQSEDDGLITHEKYMTLRDIHRQENIRKGHHRDGEE